MLSATDRSEMLRRLWEGDGAIKVGPISKKSVTRDMPLKHLVILALQPPIISFPCFQAPMWYKDKHACKHSYTQKISFFFF